MRSLPWLMEEIFEEWESRKYVPSMKAQYQVHYGDPDGLELAARAVARPLLAAVDPTPRVSLSRFQVGVHSYMQPEPNLPQGVGPAMERLSLDAITKGFYL